MGREVVRGGSEGEGGGVEGAGGEGPGVPEGADAG